MNERATVAQLRQVILALPSDLPRIDLTVWYTTQKEHWLRWTLDYHEAGSGYGRQANQASAAVVYGRVVNPYMLAWLVEAAGIEPQLVVQVRAAADGPGRLQQRAAHVRRLVPWPMVAAALWPPRSSAAQWVRGWRARRRQS